MIHFLATIKVVQTLWNLSSKPEHSTHRCQGYLVDPKSVLKMFDPPPLKKEKNGKKGLMHTD